MEKTLLNYHKYSSLNYITSVLQYLLISVKGGLESVLRPFAGKKTMKISMNRQYLCPKFCPLVEKIKASHV